MVNGIWCTLTYLSIFAFSGNTTETDSIPSAVTVYRNPEFFRNMTRGKEKEDSEEEEDKESFDNNDGEEFHDFEDEYRYPGEPKKPNPPPIPDFTTYFDESPDFVTEPREMSSSDDYEGDEEENEEEEEEPDIDQRRPEEPDHVPLEKDLHLKISPKSYEESRRYYNPIFKTGMESFSYPSSYVDLDYYRNPSKNEKLTDKKKGTREYLRDHSAEELEEEPHHPSRADSKHVFRTASKFGFKVYSPVFYAPHVLPKKMKYKVVYRPKKFRGIREIPNDSAYQLSSDYDSDFEFV